MYICPNSAMVNKLTEKQILHKVEDRKSNLNAYKKNI